MRKKKRLFGRGLKQEICKFLLTEYTPAIPRCRVQNKTEEADNWHGEPGSVFTNHSQEHSLSLSPRFANWNVTQLLIGYTIRFSQSEVVLHSNASIHRKFNKSALGTLAEAPYQL